MAAEDLQSFLASFAAQTAKADDSSSPSVHSNKPAETKLCGPTSALDLESFGADSKQPMCTPITRMASDFQKDTSGRLIAVNDSYICYSIKGNLIRVIHFIQVTRNKLAAHPATLVDLELNKDNLLASLDTQGTLRVRNIFEADGECCYSTDLEVRFPSPAQRVCWGGKDSELVAVACDKSIAVLSYQRALVLAAETSSSTEYPILEPAGLNSVGSVCEGHGATIQDLCFSPDHKCLLSASDDGTVRLWHVEGSSSVAVGVPNTGISCISTLDPHAGSPVASALFAGLPVSQGGQSMWPIITGTAANNTITLWQPKPEGGEDLWVKAHQVALHSPNSSLSKAWTNMAVDASAQFVLLANVQQSSIFVLHLKKGGGGFDLLTKWDIAHPILSFVPVRLKEATAEVGDAELQMFCIQTKAIQKYSIHPKECTPDAQVSLSPILSPRYSTPQQSGVSESRAGVAASATPPLEAVEAALKPTVAAITSASVPTSSPSLVVPPLPNLPGVSAVELQKIEGRIITAMSRVLDEKLTEAKRSAARDEDARLARLAETITKDITSAVSSAIDAKMKKYVAETEFKMKQVVRDGNQAQAQVMRTQVHGDMARVKEDIVTAVARDVKEPVLSAFKSCFQELLIPALESATQRMFGQIDEALVNRFAGLPPPATSAAAGGLISFPAAVKEPKEEIESLLGEKKYDEALMKALGAQDLDLLTWLCKKVDPGVMHGSSEVLSQTVLICLLQQLGTDLETDTLMKLGWLKEIALNLNKDEEAIAEYAPSVVDELKKSMRAFQGTEAGSPVRTELSLILRVL